MLLQIANTYIVLLAILDKHSKNVYYSFMEIRVLRYFLTVAREGSITGAANYLHLTQPTLSRQLQDLERELGQKLFIRGSHNISLTPEGMILRKRAEEILDMVEKTESEFSSLKNEIAGEIFIGSGETSSIRCVAQVIKEIQSEHPNIKFNLYSGNADDVQEKLDKGLLDFGILIQPTDISRYEYLSLKSYDTWGLVMRKDSLLANKEFITIDDLFDIPLIASRQVDKITKVKNEYIEWFGDNRKNLNIVARYNLIYNAAIMVEQGVGYALGLDGLINTTGSNELCFRPLKPILKSGLDIVWKKYQVFSPAAKLFLERMQEKIEN